MTGSKIAIVGGGMGGLSTAWHLSTDGWQDRYGSITVYQRGWRLGGKGASSRGRAGRIEEHGLHVLLGYYHETFRMMDVCYAELDRSSTDAGCPIKAWSDAVLPASDIGLADREDGSYSPWVMRFPSTPGRPEHDAGGDLDLADVVVRSLQLLTYFHAGADQPPGAWGAVEAARVLRGMGITALAGVLETLRRSGAVVPGFDDIVRTAVTRLRSTILADSQVDLRTWDLVDLVLTNLQGILADGLLRRPDGFSAINQLDYRAWLARHGAQPSTVDSAIVRGMYNLVFAYREGDVDQPAFAAGLGLQLATRMLLAYDGAIFWKMTAGMGDVIFAPLYQALVRRGVRFEFFHRLDDIELTGSRISGLTMARQVGLVREPYEPLREYGGLPGWPDEPDADQLHPDQPWAGDTEVFTGSRHDVEQLHLVDGSDFDEVVLAVSLGMIPHVAKSLLAASPVWRDMVDNVGTVATQAAQVWLRSSDHQLGWTGPDGITLSAFASPFDTWASMPHLLDHEQWENRPGAVAYFCGVLGDNEDQSADAVRRRAVSFLGGKMRDLWPDAYSDDGFRWSELVGGGEGPDRFEDQYWRANTDPSDRYVQSLPGSDIYRLKPGETGFENLSVAGDWTDSGLNAGCVEAATRSGRLAAGAIEQRLQPSSGEGGENREDHD